MFVLAVALAVTGTAAAQPAADVTRTIEMTAEQYRFVPSHIEVLEGETVRLKIRSVDVLHGLGIPAFGISERLAPGDEISVEVTAGTPGR